MSSEWTPTQQEMVSVNKRFERSLKNALRIMTDQDIMQYIYANLNKTGDGYMKAEMHKRITVNFVAVLECTDPDKVMRKFYDEYKAVHHATAEALTNKLDQTIGLDINTNYVDDHLIEAFFQKFYECATNTLEYPVFYENSDGKNIGINYHTKTETTPTMKS